MSICLYDDDILKRRNVLLNLEIMKLSTYFKKKGEIVTISPFFLPNKYGYNYFRKDYNDNQFLHTLSNDNVSFGGRAFNYNKYIPLPLEMERCVPDIYIYDKIKNSINFSSEYKTMFSSNHCRLSLDGENIWEDYRTQLNGEVKNLILHDYDLGSIKGVTNELIKLKNEFNGLRVGMKFPLIIKDNNDLFEEWLSINQIPQFFSITYNGKIEPARMFNYIGNKKVQSLTIHNNPAASCYDENDFVKNVLPIFFKEAFFFKKYTKNFLLNIDESFFQTEELKNLMILLRNFIRAGRKKAVQYVDNYTFYQFCRVCANRMSERIQYCEEVSREDIISMFDYIKNLNYDLFKLFYEYDNNTYEEEFF